MIRRLHLLWRNLVRRDLVERDLDDEVRGVFELLVEEKMAAGASPEQARRAARLEIGHVDANKSAVREVRAGAAWEAAMHDARYAVRLLARNPLFTLTATLSLAICIAANTTVFSLVNRLLLRDAPGVADPQGLVEIAATRPDGRYSEPVLPYYRYVEIRDNVTTLSGVFGYQLDMQAVSLQTGGSAERVFSTYVTANYFEVLGVKPAVGRIFGPQDDQHADGGTIILSHRFWTTRFGANPNIVGTTLTINGQPLTVVGVAPEVFRGLSVVLADMWMPTTVAARLSNWASVPSLAVGGRLKDGVSLSEASAELDVLGQRFERERAAEPDRRYESWQRGSLRAVPASAIPVVIRSIATGFLGMLMGMAALVLIIACVNLAGVLLSRATTRRREFAVRLAIGAGRPRLIRQLLTETICLFALGGAAGLVLAQIMTSVLPLALPPLPLPIDTSLPLDYRVVAFTAGASLVASLLCGLVPALRASRADVVSSLKVDTLGSSDRLRLRSAFVIGQVALSILLVVSAGLFGRAIVRSSSVNPGFDAAGVEVANLDLSLARYTGSSGPVFVQSVLDRLRTVPGVIAVTVATSLPNAGTARQCCGVSAPGTRATPANRMTPAWNAVTPGYFQALRIPLLAGRDFTADDRAGNDPVVILSATAARNLWPDGNAVGKELVWHRTPAPSGGTRETGPSLHSTGRGPNKPIPDGRLVVIGVVDDVNRSGNMVYVPFQQHYQPMVAIAARSRDGQRLTRELREAVATIDPNLPIVTTARLSDSSGPAITQLRIAAAVSSSVGVIALLLAAIGIYGVTAYSVARRTREIGIRVAMGAGVPAIVRMVLRQGLGLLLAGGAIGLALAAVGSRLLSRMLFGLPPLDPVAFGGAALVFAAIGLLACYVPVRRATRINAAEALRYE